jgi:pyruvate,water dikinase
MVPTAADPDLLARIAAQDREERGPRMAEIWDREYRPEVEALTRATLTYADGRESLPKLVDGLDEIHAARRRSGELHMLTTQLPGAAANLLIDFCVAEFGSDGEMIASEVTQGLPNKSLESGAALWDLSREAKDRPAVAEVLAGPRSDDWRERVSAAAGGSEFLDLFDAFLEDYGLRSESFNDLSFPTWREDPSFPLFLLRRYLAAGDESSPVRLHEAAARLREERLAEVEGRLAGDGGKLEAFRALLGPAQFRTIIIEDHNFYIDQRCWSAGRFPFVAIGRCLVDQGTVESAEDVFYLYEAEIREAAADPTKVLKTLVAQRRAERERWMHILPPLTIGDGDVGENSLRDRFFGGFKAEGRKDGVTKGTPASRGVVRGTARVILSLKDIDRLGPGEILVTLATSPPWTPVFAVAGGIVAEAGGVLSHCAVVAREYGIPAIVGARGATQQIEDGSLVTLDGGAGLVRVEARTTD